jgi:hypothetical protein
MRQIESRSEVLRRQRGPKRQNPGFLVRGFTLTTEPPGRDALPNIFRCEPDSAQDFPSPSLEAAALSLGATSELSHPFGSPLGPLCVGRQQGVCLGGIRISLRLIGPIWQGDRLILVKSNPSMIFYDFENWGVHQKVHIAMVDSQYQVLENIVSVPMLVFCFLNQFHVQTHLFAFFKMNVPIMGFISSVMRQVFDDSGGFFGSAGLSLKHHVC